MKNLVFIMMSVLLFFSCSKEDKKQGDDTIFPDVVREDGELREYHTEHYEIYLTAEYDLLAYKRYVDDHYLEEVTYDWSESELHISTTMKVLPGLQVNQITYVLDENKKVQAVKNSATESQFSYDDMGRLVQQDNTKKDTDGSIISKETFLHHYENDSYTLETIRELKEQECETTYRMSAIEAPFHVNFFNAKLFGQEALPLLSSISRGYSCIGGLHYTNDYVRERIEFHNYVQQDNGLVIALQRKRYSPDYIYEDMVVVYNTTFEYHIE